jgi:hypothetical protein
MNSFFDFDIKGTGILSTCFLNCNIDSFSRLQNSLNGFPISVIRIKKIFQLFFPINMEPAVPNMLC